MVTLQPLHYSTFDISLYNPLGRHHLNKHILEGKAGSGEWGWVGWNPSFSSFDFEFFRNIVILLNLCSSRLLCSIATYVNMMLVKVGK